MQSDEQIHSGTGLPVEAEEARIKAAYARRQPTMDRSLYTPFNRGDLFAKQEMKQQLLALLGRYGRHSLTDQKILEVGCGDGYWLREFIQWGAQPENLAGVDLLPEQIARAKSLSPERVTFYCGSATKLRFPDGMFDLVWQATVFTSILDFQVRKEAASEMLRVLKPDGLILWYDFLMNNPRNPDVRGVTKKNVLQLFPNCQVELRRITLAPPLARRIAPYSWLTCYFLARVPFLCTHYLGVIRKA